MELSTGVLGSCKLFWDILSGGGLRMRFKDPRSLVDSLGMNQVITLPAPANRSKGVREPFRLWKTIIYLVLMDRIGTTELTANQFRLTQTREKLKRENIRNQHDAIQTHEQVGKEVRAAITKIGGTPLENIPPAEPIKNVKKRLKNTKPVLTLDAKDALGLISGE